MRLCDRDIEAWLDEGRLAINPRPPVERINGATVDVRLGNKFRTFRGHTAPFIDLSGPKAEVSAAREGEKVGQTLECICDGVDDETGMYLLRTKADCPEIDGNVLTPADTPLETGAFYNVTITDADTYDLYGYAEEKLED